VKTVALAFLVLFLPAAEQPADRWPAEVARALDRAGDNRAELVKALRGAPAAQRQGMAFLVANMPERDLKALPADFLLENVALAYKARTEVPWGRDVPEEVFLNDVLPYANVDEARHPWRKEMYDLCLPLVKDCKSPGEAAQRLNANVFKKVKVRYSTGRKKPHQSPKESIEQGLASCTGLSILLSDACRSVCVPARLAGTPLWANKRGNHTWVEVWDKGWHFTGACEPDPQGLDRGWFVGDAAQAVKDSPRHAIYAASFRKTGLAFPLVWSPGQKEVQAENVTDRYARKKPADDTKTRVLVRVWAPGRGKRLALPVAVAERGKSEPTLTGQSRGEGADTNDILAFDLPKGREFVLRVGKPVRVEKAFKTAADGQFSIDVEVPAVEKKPGLTPEQVKQVEKAARDYYGADAAEQAKWRFDRALDRLLLENEPAVREAVWRAYRDAPVHGAMKEDFEANRVRYQKYVSPYKVKKVGKRPEGGWPLFIAMHGGGNTPKAVNDSQWEHMQRYYRDQPSVTGYQYLALRAPNDTWNGFYDEYVPPLIINLIRQSLLFGDVNPDKVYLMGYSHGGYGAFYIGPKIPDRFAAVHSSAAAPTDGAISPVTLRNTRFTYMVGEKDNAYGRRERCEKFNEVMQKIKEQNKGDYPVELELKAGFGHGGLPDRDKIKEMYAFTRNPVPRHLTWELTDAVLTHFYWLAVPQPGKGQRLDAVVSDNAVRVTTRGVKQFELALDGRLISWDKPLRVTIDGKEQTLTARPSFRTLCQTLAERGDPQLAFSWRVRLAAGASAAATPKDVREAVARALPLLRKAGAGHMEERTCFACHNQALPLLAMSTGRSRGLAVPADELKKHADFIANFLAENRANYLKGRGQGGAADTAGYALWALELAGRKPDATTAAVAEYLLQYNQALGHWRSTSNRPPSEVSPFTVTYLALRGLQTFGTAGQKGRIDERTRAARRWLERTPARDTEDRVFRLWALKRVGAGADVVRDAARELLQSQRPDGGWAQLDAMEPDAYATGSALVALHEAGGLPTTDAAYRRGVSFLLASQRADGSWHVRSRSRPFQIYFESGFPHGKDQFISAAASGWAAAALALTLPPAKLEARLTP
jgi:hypothetical protein